CVGEILPALQSFIYMRTCFFRLYQFLADSTLRNDHCEDAASTALLTWVAQPLVCATTERNRLKSMPLLCCHKKSIDFRGRPGISSPRLLIRRFLTSRCCCTLANSALESCLNSRARIRANRVFTRPKPHLTKEPAYEPLLSNLSHKGR